MVLLACMDCQFQKKYRLFLVFIWITIAFSRTTVHQCVVWMQYDNELQWSNAFWIMDRAPGQPTLFNIPADPSGSTLRSYVWSYQGSQFLSQKSSYCLIIARGIMLLHDAIACQAILGDRVHQTTYNPYTATCKYVVHFFSACIKLQLKPKKRWCKSIKCT